MLIDLIALLKNEGQAICQTECVNAVKRDQRAMVIAWAYAGFAKGGGRNF